MTLLEHGRLVGQASRPVQGGFPTRRRLTTCPTSEGPTYPENVQTPGAGFRLPTPAGAKAAYSGVTGSSSTSPEGSSSPNMRPSVPSSSSSPSSTPSRRSACGSVWSRSEEHTSELQSPCNLVCRLL